MKLGSDAQGMMPPYPDPAPDLKEDRDTHTSVTNRRLMNANKMLERNISRIRAHFTLLMSMPGDTVKKSETAEQPPTGTFASTHANLNKLEELISDVEAFAEEFSKI